MRTGLTRRLRRPIVLLGAAAAAGLLSVVATVPAGAAPAAAAIPNQWGYVFADQPTTATYDASNNGFSRSSAFGAITVTRQSTGQYLINFAGLSGTGGTVDVTAADTHQKILCQSGGLEGSAKSVRMLVRCFDVSGAPTDSQFYAAFAHAHSASGRFAYGAYTPGTPNKPYTFSTGGKISIKHVNTGLFQVDLAGLASPGGTVVTTPISVGPRICSPVSWHPAGNAERIFVVCTSPDGAVTDDVAFAFTFADHQGLFGNRNFGVGYTWASNTTANSYLGPKAYSFMHGGGTGRPRITSEIGSYVVTFPKLVGPDNVQVRPTGGPGRSCQVFSLSITTNTRVTVACYDGQGVPVMSQFVISVVGGPLP